MGEIGSSLSIAELVDRGCCAVSSAISTVFFCLDNSSTVRTAGVKPQGKSGNIGEDHQIPFEHEEHHEGPHRVVLCHEFGTSCCHHVRGWGLRLASWDPSPPLKLTCAVGENSRQRGSEVWRNPHHSGHGSDCVTLGFSPQCCQPHVVCHPCLPKRAVTVRQGHELECPTTIMCCCLQRSRKRRDHGTRLRHVRNSFSSEIERFTTTRRARRGKTTRRDFCI